MIKLNNLSPNSNELITPFGDGILFSYRTPVGISLAYSGTFYRTSEKFSRTTSRHISDWSPIARPIKQSALERVVELLLTGERAEAFRLLNDCETKADK